MASGMTAASGDEVPPDLPGIEILRLLGRGGMGAVYLGTQLGLGRDVAVKVVAAELAGDPLFLERLEREARTMARLRHPNLVTVHHFERLASGGAAIVMEYVEGGTLRDRIALHPAGLPLDDALRWIRETGGALAAAHASGVVHRDMKPENVLVDDRGTARVTDFGLAVPMAPGTPRLTLTGAAVGTLDYMAPECFRDSPPDARADVFALGVMLYEMLTGRVPRGSFDAPRVLRPEVPRPLSEATMKALRPDPDERPADMAAFLAMLDGAEKSAGIGRRKLLSFAGLAGIAAAGGYWKFFKPPPPDPVAGPNSLPSVTPGADGWRDALATADLADGVISGQWQRQDSQLVTDSSVCILALEKEMPAAYEVRARFVRLSGEHSVAIFFSSAGGTGSVDIDGWDLGLAGVQSIDGRDLRQGGGFKFTLEDGRRYELVVEVRPEQVRIRIDGRELGTAAIAGRTLGIVFPWGWDPASRPAALGIGSYQSPTRFESVEWRPLAEG